MDVPADIARADVILAGIVLPLLVAAGAAALTPVGIAVALAAGSVPASETVDYALFYAPPRSV